MRLPSANVSKAEAAASGAPVKVFGQIGPRAKAQAEAGASANETSSPAQVEAFAPAAAALIELIREDRVCEVLQAESSLDILVEALVAVPSSPIGGSGGASDRVLLDAFRSFYSGRLSEANSSIETDFFNALLLAGLVDGAKSVKQDPREADRLLVDLSRRDRDNGAFPYFRAAVLRQLKEPKEAVRRELKEAFRAPRFDSFTTSLARAVREKAYASPSHFALAGLITYRMPVPNYIEPLKLVHWLVDEGDPETARLASAFARRLMDPALEIGGDYEFSHWSALEYAIGTSILARAWPQAYPGRPEPAYPNYADVIKRDPRLESLFEKANEDMMDLGAKPYSPGKQCRRDNYDALFSAERAVYLEFLSR